MSLYLVCFVSVHLPAYLSFLLSFIGENAGMMSFHLVTIGIYFKRNLVFNLCCKYFKYNVLKFIFSILKYRPALLATLCHALLTLHILIGQISTSGSHAKLIISVV